MQRKETFWYVLLWASFVAAVVSLMTTGIGLRRYLSFLLAWPLALAVQAGLFGLAWLIAVGRKQLRPLVITLYLVTMPFSVVFSYVMLQSEFTASIKPQEARRALYDQLRANTAEVTSALSAGIGASEELGLRLGDWLEMEKEAGWTMSTCDDEEHCYLDGVCRRVGRKIDNWERSFGLTYKQGPGEALIYGLLETEIGAIARINSTLTDFRDGWTANEELFAGGLDNRERLRRYDAALAGFPQDDLEAVLCRAAALPPPPAYGSFARDSADGDETPVYAFQDLTAIFAPEHDFGRGDYPTVFAFGLAAFIDLFVLLVAIGAALLPEASAEKGSAYPVLRLVPPEWSDSLRRDITEWIDGSLLHTDLGRERRQEFLARVVDALRFERGGRAVLVPEDAAQSRFGFLMTRAQAATPTGMRGGDSEVTGFVLEEWVYPALTRYLAPEPGTG
ncbi:MAG: hypothetical protein ACE5EG_04640 [Thermoanaerobaculia bacterium]